VARDRKRAKQRRERREATGARQGRAGGDGTGTVPPSQPARADVPGALDHASADVDEFDAALIRGADGVAATPESSGGVTATPDTGLEEDVPGEVEGELPGGAEDELQAPPGGAGGDGGPGAGGGGRGGPGRDGERPSGAPLRGGNRAIAFLRASWAELQRVQWPDRRQVTQATAVVLGFVAIAGLYLGLADFVAKEIVELVL
jgi:preprotein translocase subunit SecE